MTDCLLINPPYSYTDLIKTKAGKKHKGFYVNYPHLGLAYLAASLERNKFSVKIIEASAFLMNEEEILENVAKEAPKIIGITVTTLTLPVVYSLVKQFKKNFPDICLVLGGSHISLDPELIEKLGVNFGFVGEADNGFAQLCGHILGEKINLENIKGLVYRKDEKLFINERDLIRNMDDVPFPARNLLPNDQYFSPVIKGRITSMITSRGCPFNCTYCSRPAIGKICRFRSPENIVEEILEVKNKYHVKYINFEDDTFTLRQQNIIKLCELIISKGIKIKWGCQTRAHLVNESLLKLMRDAGCIKVSFGVEAGSEKIRYSLNKNITDEAFRKAFRLCHKFGMETTSFFMFGHPNETINDLKRTISFAQELSPTYAAFNISIILPASPLFIQAKKEGLITDDTWHKYMLGQTGLPVYVPSGLSRKILEEYQRKAFRAFYFHPKYLFKRIFDRHTYANFANIIRIAKVVIRDFMMK